MLLGAEVFDSWWAAVPPGVLVPYVWTKGFKPSVTSTTRDLRKRVFRCFSFSHTWTRTTCGVLRVLGYGEPDDTIWTERFGFYSILAGATVTKPQLII